MRLGHYVGLILLIVSLYILWQIRQLLLLLFTAVVIATALNKIVKHLENGGIKRGWAVFLTVFILGGVLLIFTALIVPPFTQQFQELIYILPKGLVAIQNAINWLDKQFLGRFFPNFTLIIDDLIRQIQPFATQVLQSSLDFFSTSINVLLQLLLLIVLTLMLLANPKPYRNVFIRLFPSFYRPRVKEILSRCQEALESWTIGVLIEMFFVGALSGIGLWILQVPLVLAHAILAGLLNIIPNIGPTLSVFLPMAIAFLDAPWKAIAVLILYIIVQQVETFWLTPVIMAKQVALLPAITLTAQLIFAGFFGALGLLMALPLTVIAKTWIEELLFKDVLDKWKYQPSQPENH
jgi:predicted PurR-regulated permease PerM